jgi:site-specific recombinase XerC
VHTRVAQGAAVSTVRLELSAIRGFWQFMLDMKAPDVLLNPARGVKVPRQRQNLRLEMPIHSDPADVSDAL